jgi:hypothetical protein
MAIQSMDGLIAALPGVHRHVMKLSMTTLQGGFFSLWKIAGQPGAAVSPPTGSGEVPTSATPGAIPFPNPTAPALTYLAQMAFVGVTPGNLILYDRLAHTSGLAGNVNTAQAVDTPALTRPDAGGDDVELWLEWYTATGATAANVTAAYTNQAGASKTTVSTAVPTSAAAGRMFQLPLAAGDTGVRSVQSVTLSASTGTAGDIGVTLLRRVAELPLTGANVLADRDGFALGLPQVPDSACLALMLNASASTSGQIVGSLTLAQG